jgi:hypothetical protein
MKWKDPAPKPMMGGGNPWQQKLIGKFSGGLVTSTTANQLEENQFTQMENLLFNPDGTLRTRNGKRPAVGATDANRILKASGSSVTHPSAPGGTYHITGTAKGSRGRVAFTFSDDISAFIEDGDIFTIAGAVVTPADPAQDALINADHVADYVHGDGLTINTNTKNIDDDLDAADFTNATWTIGEPPTEAKAFFAEEVEGTEELLMAVENAATTATEIRYYDGEDYTTILHTMTSGSRPLFEKYAQGSVEEVIIANGVDTPQRWNRDDATTSDLGLAMALPVVSIEAGVATPAVTLEGDYIGTFQVNDQFIMDSDANPSGYQLIYKITGALPTVLTGGNTVYECTSYAISGGGQGSATNTPAGAFVSGTLYYKIRWDAKSADTTDPNNGMSYGQYYYKYTFQYNESGTTKYGETNGSKIMFDSTNTNVGSVGANLQFETKEIYFPPGVEAVNFYRGRPDRRDVFYYVGRVTTNGGTFKDSTPVGAEGLPLPIDDGSVPNIKYPINVDGRIVAVDGDKPNKLVWTPRGSCDLFLALDYIYFRDNIVGVHEFNGSVYVFTRRAVFAIPNSDFATGLAIKICEKGAVSHRSIVDVGSGLVWLGEDNVYWANFNTQTSEGDFPIAVGRPVQDLILQQSQLKRENACATFYDRHYYLSFATAGSTDNNVTLAMNTDIMQQALRIEGAGWSRMDWVAIDLYAKEELMYSLELNTEGGADGATATYYIYEHDNQRYVDYTTQTLYEAATETDIDINLRSGELHFGSPVTNKLIRGMSISYYGDNATYNITLDANSGEYKKNITIDKTGESPSEGERSGLIWSTSSIAEGAWYGYPAATEGWFAITSMTAATQMVMEVTGDWSTIPAGTKVSVYGAVGDYRYNTEWTVASASAYEAVTAGETVITMNESSSGWDAISDYTNAVAYAQWGTKTDADNAFTWSTSQRRNHTIRKKNPTMKCDRFIYELTGKGHRDTRLGAVGIIYKVLPTAF